MEHLSQLGVKNAELLEAVSLLVVFGVLFLYLLLFLLFTLGYPEIPREAFQVSLLMKIEKKQIYIYIYSFLLGFASCKISMVNNQQYMNRKNKTKQKHIPTLKLFPDWVGTYTCLFTYRGRVLFVVAKDQFP